MEEKLELLGNLVDKYDLTEKEKESLDEVISVVKTLFHKRTTDEFDFQGWPVKKITMKDLRRFVRENGPLGDEVKLFVLQDDGMGYGAINGYCSDLLVGLNDEGNNEVQIWF